MKNIEHENIILVGLVGAGKTTLGKKIAKRLKREFIDIDKYIIERTGVDILTIFDKEGEEGFRDRETKALIEVTEKYKDSVIATGGGCILKEENQKIIRGSGLVIHLDVSLKTLNQRLMYDKVRPLLQVDSVLEKLKQLHYERDHLYRKTSHISLKVDKMKFSEIINKINQFLNDNEKK